MAKLYFYYASMNAGKSTNLLQADFNYRERGMATMLWTAALDTRSEGMIRSRIGLEADANRYTPGTDLWAETLARHNQTALACVLIDEAQFLTAKQVWQCARLADEANIRQVIMFPMNQRAEDLMMGAPSEPTNEQLRDLRLRPLPNE